MANSIELHFDGDIVFDHRVSVRTLGKSLLHLQSALDRAQIERTYGSVWKHARLPAALYQSVEFIAEYPEEGGFRITAVAGEIVENAEQLVRRVWSAVRSVADAPMREGLGEAARLVDQLENRRIQLASRNVRPQSYERLLDNPDPEMVRVYGDRSIGKEIDQILSSLRHRNAGESSLEIRVEIGRRRHQELFDRASSRRFHTVVSRRELGRPVRYHGSLRSLDRGGRYNLQSGKFTLLPRKRDINLHIADVEDFDRLVPYLSGEEIEIIGAPVLEFGAYDPVGGDVFFIDVV